MSTSFVDSIMKQVEKKYQLDFYINRDADLTREIAKRIQKKNVEAYNGMNGKYTPNNRMYCTEQCSKEGNVYRVHQGGIVYGPYQRFVKGVYYAFFDFECSENNSVILEVSAGGEGYFARHQATSSEDGMVSFELPQTTEQLEFKVINEGALDVIFRSVNVYDRIPEKAENNTSGATNVSLASETVTRPSEGTVQSREAIPYSDYDFTPYVDSSVDLFERISNITGYINSGISNAEKMQECPLPVQTKAKFLKRVVRRIIKCYTRFQIDFNRFTVGIIQQLHQKMNMLAEGNRMIFEGLASAVNQFENENTALRSKIGSLKAQLEQKNEEMLIKFRQENEMLQKRQDELFNLVKDSKGELDQLFSGYQTAFHKLSQKVQENDDLWKRIDAHASDIQDIWGKEEKTAEILAQMREENQNTIRGLVAKIQDVDNIWKKIGAHDADIQGIWEKEAKSAETILRMREENHDALRGFTVKMQDLDNIWKKIEAHDTDIQDIWRKEEQTRSEFTDLWNKCKEIDHEFENSWLQARKTGTELGELWNSYQMLRRELFYEIDYRLRRAASEDAGIFLAPTNHGTLNRERLHPMVKSNAKEIIAENDGKIRLNLGCGHVPVKGYVNVDARDLPGVDIVADIASLPFEKESVDEIFSAHLIEHFEITVLEQEIMPYWVSLLKFGGQLRVVFPDAAAMIADYNSGKMTFEELSHVVMGGQDYDKDYHYTMYDPQKVINLLQKAGLKNIQIVAQGRENGGCRETEIVAFK